MKQILLLILLFSITACKKEFPDLLNKELKYSDKDFSGAHFQDFSVYENVTTKNSKIPKAKTNTKKQYPWEIAISQKRAEETADQIKKSITAITDGASDYNKEPSSSIYFYALVDNFYTKEQLSEYEKTESITTQKSILDYIKATVKSYELTNEKNEKIKLNQNGLGLNLGGFETKNGKLLQGIAFQTMGMGNSEYLRLKGHVVIEIEIPVEYEKEEISENNIGDTFTIGGQKVQILEFDADVIHYKLFDSDAENFSIYVDNYGKIKIPENTYTKFRNNQGLDYDSFLKKYKEFGLENMQYPDKGNFVSVLRSDDSQLEKVFFYSPKASKLVKKTIRIPVNIQIK
ncbi:hypothetical protein ACFFLS_08895 [Flavobacterium procerum]|uniref:Uncharacterized protein n=1 Tax=Flavobacterium procerum TaxID=1455569 RepID=A0ABV6BSY0_9FLAO